MGRIRACELYQQRESGPRRQFRPLLCIGSRQIDNHNVFAQSRQVTIVPDSARHVSILCSQRNLHH